jgi:hypothetical protein
LLISTDTQGRGSIAHVSRSGDNTVTGATIYGSGDTSFNLNQRQANNILTSEVTGNTQFMGSLANSLQLAQDYGLRFNDLTIIGGELASERVILDTDFEDSPAGETTSRTEITYIDSKPGGGCRLWSGSGETTVVERDGQGRLVETRSTTDEGTSTVTYTYPPGAAATVTLSGPIAGLGSSARLEGIYIYITGTNYRISTIDGHVRELRDGRWVICDSQECNDVEEAGRANANLEDRLRPDPTAAERWQSFYGGLDFLAGGGFGQLWTLLADEDDVAEWREEVDNAFNDAYLTADSWYSLICDEFPESGDDEPSTFMFDIPGQGIGVGIHIEGTRQSLGVTELGVNEYIYKFTYYIKNPSSVDDDYMYFNIYAIRESDDKEVAFWPDDTPTIEPGGVFSAGDTYPQIITSENKYDKVCITLTEAVRDFRGNEQSKFCNTIEAAGFDRDRYQAADVLDDEDDVDALPPAATAQDLPDASI